MKYPLLVILLFFSVLVKGQNTIVRGTITDAHTNQILSLVSVSFPGTSSGVSSDSNGKYAITTGKTYTELKFTSIGYKTVTRIIIAGKVQLINVKMQPDVQALTTVNISSGKRKRYTN
ncbi:MAG: hypothetical protein JWP44_1580 [Mucilaginibacter sp.]|nr:hypothetical protein [Mucilaginibacter sp.]